MKAKVDKLTFELKSTKNSLENSQMALWKAEDQIDAVVYFKKQENEARAKETKQVVDELDKFQEDFHLEHCPKKSGVGCTAGDNTRMVQQKSSTPPGGSRIGNRKLPILIWEPSEIFKHEKGVLPDTKFGFQLTEIFRSSTIDELQKNYNWESSYPWNREEEFEEDEILHNDFSIPNTMEIQYVDSIWEEQQECKLMGLEEPFSQVGMFSTLEQNDMVIDFACSRSPQSDEHYHESEVGCVEGNLSSVEASSSTRRSLNKAHINIKVAQHKHGGATSWLSTHARDHQQSMLEVCGDRRNVPWKTIAQNFRLGIVVIIQISHHMISFAYIQVGKQVFSIKDWSIL
ncbi:hypothetical protein KI387_043776 [Taxus chinensis]|uniref:Uncharacterized protein n=1 Tax=Taxus chinensis TaxID=29808 RepID=A0AA38GTF0_TAXCH|nr:hypothetical protein KI387_043776 [Taxus chinensis]